MARSKYKLKFFSKKIWRILVRINNKKLRWQKPLFKLYASRSTIPQLFNKFKFRIYKGNTYKKIKIKPIMYGQKFGELLYTRKPFFFPLKEKTIKKKK